MPLPGAVNNCSSSGEEKVVHELIANNKQKKDKYVAMHHASKRWKEMKHMEKQSLLFLWLQRKACGSDV